MYEDLINNLHEHSEWAHANEWESPITLGDDLEEAIKVIEALQVELDTLRKMQPVKLEKDEARSFVMAAELSEARAKLAKSETERDRFEQMYLQSEVDATNLTGELAEVSVENSRLRREREAAVADMKKIHCVGMMGCRICKSYIRCPD